MEVPFLAVWQNKYLSNPMKTTKNAGQNIYWKILWNVFIIWQENEAHSQHKILSTSPLKALTNWENLSFYFYKSARHGEQQTHLLALTNSEPTNDRAPEAHQNCLSQKLVLSRHKKVLLKICNYRQSSHGLWVWTVCVAGPQTSIWEFLSPCFTNWW